MLPKVRDELFTLMDALLNDTISADQQRRLESILLAEPEARDLFRQYVALHCELRQLAQSYAQEKLLRLTEANESVPTQPAPSTEPPRPGTVYGIILSFFVGLIAGAMCLRHFLAEASAPVSTAGVVQPSAPDITGPEEWTPAQPSD